MKFRTVCTAISATLCTVVQLVKLNLAPHVLTHNAYTRLYTQRSSTIDRSFQSVFLALEMNRFMTLIDHHGDPAGIAARSEDDPPLQIRTVDKFLMDDLRPLLTQFLTVYQTMESDLTLLRSGYHEVQSNLTILAKQNRRLTESPREATTGRRKSYPITITCQPQNCSSVFHQLMRKRHWLQD